MPVKNTSVKRRLGKNGSAFQNKKDVGVTQLEEGDTNLAQVLNNLVHGSSIGEHAKQLLKLPPLPYNDAIATFVLHELSVKPGRRDLLACC